MKKYIISGMWSYICEAESEDEAMEKLDVCPLTDIDIDFTFPNIEEEEIEA